MILPHVTENATNQCRASTNPSTIRDRSWLTILFDSLKEFKPASGKTGKLYSLPALEKAGIGKISRLPVSIRIVLESSCATATARR
jgi:hypothetical protein